MTSENSTRSDSHTDQQADDLLDRWVAQANLEFEELCRTRHQTGDKEYGHNTFLQAPVMDMAMEEIADMCNYARYLYIRLWMLRQHVAQIEKDAQDKTMAADAHGFIPLSQIK